MLNNINKKKALIAVGFCILIGAPFLQIYLSDDNGSQTKEPDASQPFSAQEMVNYKALIDEQDKSISQTTRMGSFFSSLKPEKVNNFLQEKDSAKKVELTSGFSTIGHFTAPVLAEKKEEVPSSLITEDFSIEEYITIPFGRMLKCELVNAVDSINLQTPLLGILMEPLWVDGVMVLPAGCEIHGLATTDKVKERICSNKQWTVVFPPKNSKWSVSSIQLKGSALDREDKTGEGKTFGITDGTYGIRGRRVQSAQMDELKFFAAAFLETALSGLEQTEPIGGIWPDVKIVPSARDASLAGSSAVLGEYANMLKEELVENKYYTFVPAGKQFYLYVEEEIHVAIGTDGFRIVTYEEKRRNQSIERSIKQVVDFFANNTGEESDYENA